MRYEWDEAKNSSNFAKHGLRFEDAELVFSGPCITFVDDRFDYGEERFIAVGYIGSRLYVSVYTDRGDTRRIIGLRKANPREDKNYAQVKT